MFPPIGDADSVSADDPPGLGGVGPSYSYAPLPELAKIWLSVCM